MNKKEDLWERLVRSESGCWEIPGRCPTRRGGQKDYPRFQAEGTNHKIHRLAYSLTFGEIPAGFQVCHRCDNPYCANPAHLFLGTNKDNCQDKARKGRSVAPPNRERREERRQLTDKEAEFIRTSSLSQRQLARMFGVSRGTIRSILNGRSYFC